MNNSQDITIIRERNDHCRLHWKINSVFLTLAVVRVSDEDRFEIIKGVCTYQAFLPDADLRDEHDFGCLTAAGHHVVWTIDAAKRTDGDHGSAKCILTIMLGHEYWTKHSQFAR